MANTHAHTKTKSHAHHIKDHGAAIKDMPRGNPADETAYTEMFNRSKAVGLDANSTIKEVIAAEDEKLDKAERDARDEKDREKDEKAKRDDRK